MEATAPEFLTRAELAKRLKITERSIDRAIRDGKVKPTRFGRAVRFAPDEVKRVEREGFAV